MPTPFEYLDETDEERDLLAPLGPPPEVIPVPAIDDVALEAESPAPGPRFPMLQARGAPVAPLDVRKYGAGEDRAALAAAEEQRDGTDRSEQLLNAASLINRAGGGHAGDLGASARAKRNDGFQDVMRRRAMDDQELARGKAARSAELDAALARGDSPESVKTKDNFSATSVGKALRERMGEEAWARLPGSAIPGAKDQLSSETQLMLAGAKASARQGGAKLGLERLVNAAGGPESPRGQWYAQTFADATDDDLKKAWQVFVQESGQGFTAGQNDLNRKTQIEAARIAAQRKDEMDREGQTEAISKDLKEGGGFGSNLQIINEVLDKSKTTKTGDIPGQGLVDNLKNEYFGGFLERDPEGMRLNKAAKSMMLAYRNLVTGSAASNQEDQRIAQAGLSMVNPDAFRVGLENMSRRYYDLLKRTYAGKDPRAVQVFVARNPDYEIPGDERFSADVSKKAAAKYAALGNLESLRPALVEFESVKGGHTAVGAPESDAGINGAPPVPTATPVQEPGGAVAPVPATKVRVRNRATGQTGLITAPFDPAKYELVP